MVFAGMAAGHSAFANADAVLTGDDGAFSATTASTASLDLSGTWVYKSDKPVGEHDCDAIIYFPSSSRQDGGVGYENLPRPKEEIYVKIAANHPFTITYDQDNPGRIKVTHLSFSGCKTNQSSVEGDTTYVSLNSQGNEVVETTANSLSIAIYRGSWSAGEKVNITVTKLDSNTIRVIDVHTGWAPLPIPFPVTGVAEFILNRVN